MGQGRRSQPLPREWHRLRGHILKRDGHQCTVMENGQRCPAKATDVDHTVPVSQGGTDADDNLRAMCREHHNRKTAAEANAANPKAIPQRRASESHPGIVPAKS